MSKWVYTFFHHDSYGIAKPCQNEACSKRATYRLVAENGVGGNGARNYCTNHAEAAADRVKIAFPPVGSKQALGQGNK